MVLTHGNQATLRYVAETTAGTFPTNPALLNFSKQTMSAKLFLDKNHKEIMDLDDYVVDGHYSVTNTYGLEVSYKVYDVDRVTEFWARDANLMPTPYSFELIPNQDAAVPHYMRGTGWRPQSCSLKGRVDEAWEHSVTFTGGKLTTPVTGAPSIGTGSREAKSAITDSLRTFSSGAILYNGAAFGILLDEFEVNVDHGSTARYTNGDANPIPGATTYGKRKISGTANYSLEDGGKAHFDLVDAFAASIDIVVPFSVTAGQPKLTFSNAVLPRWEMELAADKDVVMGSQPWSATTYTQGTV